MPDEPRNWTRTYASVVAVEVIVLLALLWLQSHFGI
jgi:hypothetical protein